MAFNRQVNETWMEALDVGSGRLYFVKLEVNRSGDVRPLGETSWEAPEGFLVRRDLCAALADASAQAQKQESDEEFMARVRQRFPPPATPPPSSAAEVELERLRYQASQFEGERIALQQRVQQLEAQLAAATPAAAPSPGMPKPSWKRGASAKFVGVQQQIPPPPAWALSKSSSGYVDISP